MREHTKIYRGSTTTCGLRSPKISVRSSSIIWNPQLQGGANLQSTQLTFTQELIPKFFQEVLSKTLSIFQVFLSKLHSNLQEYK